MLAVVMAAALCPAAPGPSRFPQPQFETGHTLPVTTTPMPAPAWRAHLDVLVLVGALSLSSWLALRRRSRPGLLALSLASMVYFGFWRKGCICPVGSLQNVALGCIDASYTVPVTVVAFFVLPLIFTLLFGRTFCAAVCPLGVMQDLVVVRPLRLPLWLSTVLSVGPAIYLGAALLLVAAGGMFLVCRYDPFVGFYRLSGPAPMLVAGGVLLLIGLFIARPYCRFLCPYGVLLNLASRLSRRHLTIAPDDCIDCRLCQGSCPFDAIRFPVAPPTPEQMRRDTRSLALLLAFLPAALVAGWSLGSGLGPRFAELHKTVRLAHETAAWKRGAALPAGSLEVDAFVQGARPVEELQKDARRIQGGFRLAAGVFGAAVGALLIGKLVALVLRRRVAEHTPDRGHCLSCGRCFRFCPPEHERLRLGLAPAALQKGEG
jgi:NosR/NirI family nitrous oxide reductase transcriptional regulator